MHPLLRVRGSMTSVRVQRGMFVVPRAIFTDAATH